MINIINKFLDYGKIQSQQRMKRLRGLFIYCGYWFQIYYSTGSIQILKYYSMKWKTLKKLKKYIIDNFPKQAKHFASKFNSQKLDKKFAILTRESATSIERSKKIWQKQE